MSPAATTPAEGVGSESQPQAIRRTAKVATMRPVGILLLALTPLISCRLPIGIRYPRELSDAQMYIAWLAETKGDRVAYPRPKQLRMAHQHHTQRFARTDEAIITFL
jgi:hypothetical protein